MKQEKIVNMFNSIAKSYDMVNRITSFGIDKKWREISVESVEKIVNKGKIDKIVDVACGTGDMIKEWRKNFHQTKIIGIDPSEEMLKVANKRFEDIQFLQAFGIELPLKNEEVDILSISFGIRNIIEIKTAINEFYRILKPNGKVLVLEFTKNDKSNYFRGIIDFYTNKILPIIAGSLSNNKEAYQYLSKSIENFYTPKELVLLFEQNSFKCLKMEQFNFGQVSMFIFEKKC